MQVDHFAGAAVPGLAGAAVDDGGNAIERFMQRHDCAVAEGWTREVDETE